MGYLAHCHRQCDVPELLTQSRLHPIQGSCPDPHGLQPPITYEDMGVVTCLERACILMEFFHWLHQHSQYQMLCCNKTCHPGDRPIRRAQLDGYMNPISYRYVPPRDMVAMHNDIHLQAPSCGGPC